MPSEKYEKLMDKCFKLALKSKGKNIPNPYVGAIIYDEKKDEILSQGYHECFGKPHAEVNAIKNAPYTKETTLIVNLEPCSHYGKTPPCADLIIKSGIKKVVIGMLDPNPLVQGKGIEKLKKAGIEVVLGVLEKKARELNKIFIKNILKQKPYVMLKIATTLDGKIALDNGKSKWITNEKSRTYVQKLRSKYQAIMSSSGTILKDNPKLNVRLKGKKSPTRIIIDRFNKIPKDYNVFNSDGVEVILINEFCDFDTLFRDLYKKGICSTMVEAGEKFSSELLKSKEVDEINQFIAPKIFGSGKNFVSGFNIENIDDCIKLENVIIKNIEGDIFIKGEINYD